MSSMQFIAFCCRLCGRQKVGGWAGGRLRWVLGSHLSTSASCGAASTSLQRHSHLVLCTLRHRSRPKLRRLRLRHYRSYRLPFSQHLRGVLIFTSGPFSSRRDIVERMGSSRTVATLPAQSLLSGDPAESLSLNVHGRVFTRTSA